MACAWTLLTADNDRRGDGSSGRRSSRRGRSRHPLKVVRRVGDVLLLLMLHVVVVVVVVLWVAALHSGCGGVSMIDLLMLTIVLMLLVLVH